MVALAPRFNVRSVLQASLARRARGQELSAFFAARVFHQAATVARTPNPCALLVTRTPHALGQELSAQLAAKKLEHRAMTVVTAPYLLNHGAH